MAISKTIELKNNFDDVSVFQNSYIKVKRIIGGKQIMTAEVGFFRQAEGQELKSENYVFSPDLAGANFIVQAYNHLKTLPEFSGAVDC
jgi:hypothetical protein